jgi:hypothetical protein
LSRFEELSRRAAARSATLYAFDFIENDGEDLRDLPFLDRKAALARLLRDTKAGILVNEHIVKDGPTVFARVSARRWRHRFQEGGRYLSIRSLPRLDQGSRSRQHSRAAGAQRDLERPSLRQRPLAITRCKSRRMSRATA